MGGIRVRWRSVGKVAAAVAAVAIALELLPGAFAAPQAPPLAPDVGLAGVAIEQAPRPIEHEPRPRRRPPQPQPRPSRGVAPATAVLGTTPRRREPEPQHPQAPAPSPPSPASEPVVPMPPVQPAPAPPAPPAPEDGSMEFAPH